MNKAPMLNDDLMTEILSQLPVKSLSRFRCVCKSWKFLFTDSTFVQLHLQSSAKHSNILLDYDYPCNFYSRPFVGSCSVPSLLENSSFAVTEHGNVSRWKRSYRIVGSCNGLVCLRKTHSRKEYWIRFWNPAMRLRSKKSPCLRGPDFTASAAVFGFGYDDSSDCYKVVAVMSDSVKTEVKVHCMGDTCWTMIASLPSFPILRQMDGVFVSGTVNWVALRRSGFRYSWRNVSSVKELLIFSFHLGKNTYKHFPFPDGVDELPLSEPKIAILRDCLCLFLDCREASHHVLWQMKEFGVEESWTPLVHLRCAGCEISMPLCGYVPIPISLCLYDNDHILPLICETDKAKAILCCQRNGRLVRVKAHCSQCGTLSIAVEYVQSMVLPLPAPRNFLWET